MSPPPPQSRFQEGSMNDRTSNAPPPDFMGPEPEDYERHFAMDWKPPDLDGFDDNAAAAAHAPAPTPLGPQHHRSSFLSTSSGGSGGGNKAAAGPQQRQTGSGPGFFRQVRERLSLTRSKSSFSVTAAADEPDMADSAGGFHIPPVFKHKRSESMGVPTSLRNGTAGAQHQHQQHQQHQRPDFSFLRRNTVDDSASRAHDNTPAFTRVTTNATAPPAPFFEPSPPVAQQPSLPGAGPLLPGFDPTRRPTREEIAANYQNLLASGFFGTHAIQSTRFSAPGSALHGRDSRASFSSSSQRLADDEGASQGIRTVPPSPERMAPPPPPPVLHAEPMDMEDSPSETTAAAVPFGDAVVFSPAAPADMPPPPALAPAKKLRPAHHHSHSYSSAAPSAARPNPQHSFSFSTVPYSSTNAGAAPIMAARPPAATGPPQRAHRPPPSTSARFSVDSAARPRGSFDFSSLSRVSSGRGLKRPFASTLANGSQTSFGSGGYDSGIGVATSTPEEKHESGARKFVKRLRKSASRISINLGSTMSRQSLQQRSDDDDDDDDDDDEMMQDGDDCRSGGGGSSNNNNNNNISLEQSSSRTSMSSNVKRSFSFRFGAGGKPDMASDGGPFPTSTDHPFPPDHHHHHPSSSTSSLRPDFFGGASAAGDDRNHFSLNSGHGSTGSASPAPFPAAHPSISPGLSVIAGSPNSDAAAADQHRSRLKKREMFRGRRPRRYDGNAGLGAEASSPSPTPPQLNLGTGAEGDGDASGDGMEGVEFSFHFPGRKRPGVPLGPVPDANRGVPGGVVATGGFPGIFKGGGAMTRGGSVRVVPRDLI